MAVPQTAAATSILPAAGHYPWFASPQQSRGPRVRDDSSRNPLPFHPPSVQRVPEGILGRFESTPLSPWFLKSPVVNHQVDGSQDTEPDAAQMDQSRRSSAFALSDCSSRRSSSSRGTYVHNPYCFDDLPSHTDQSSAMRIDPSDQYTNNTNPMLNLSFSSNSAMESSIHSSPLYPELPSPVTYPSTDPFHGAPSTPRSPWPPSFISAFNFGAMDQLPSLVSHGQSYPPPRRNTVVEPLLRPIQVPTATDVDRPPILLKRRSPPGSPDANPPPLPQTPPQVTPPPSDTDSSTDLGPKTRSRSSPPVLQSSSKEDCIVRRQSQYSVTLVWKPSPVQGQSAALVRFKSGLPPCSHPRPWRRLRAKRGITFFACSECDARLRLRHADLWIAEKEAEPEEEV